MKALLEPDKLYVAPSASLQACWFANHAAVTICGQFFARIPFGLAGREISRPHHCPLTTWVNFSFSFFKLPIWSISLSMVSARERFSSFITPSSACNALRSGSCPFSQRSRATWSCPDSAAVSRSSRSLRFVSSGSSRAPFRSSGKSRSTSCSSPESAAADRRFISVALICKLSSWTDFDLIFPNVSSRLPEDSESSNILRILSLISSTSFCS
mmetsp:Transcript_106795/g.254969  ORF Transcript_106795/g.254969 Transcript_106795/m.254969 type:complete len:213 (+) Transcript_106795:128-766(+)